MNYKCTCTQIAYGANEDGTNMDRSFSENVCDTYENIETSFEQGGGIYKGLQTCEEEMSALSDEFECECDCFYQSGAKILPSLVNKRAFGISILSSIPYGFLPTGERIGCTRSRSLGSSIGPYFG